MASTRPSAPTPDHERQELSDDYFDGFYNSVISMSTSVEFNASSGDDDSDVDEEVLSYTTLAAAPIESTPPSSNTTAMVQIVLRGLAPLMATDEEYTQAARQVLLQTRRVDLIQVRQTVLNNRKHFIEESKGADSKQDFKRLKM